MPQFSIIIPTRNRADLLSEAIESVLNQRYSDFELIAADDGSTDHTPEVVAAFQDPRFRYHRQENLEKGHALVAGVALSQGEIGESAEKIVGLLQDHSSGVSFPRLAIEIKPACSFPALQTSPRSSQT